MFAANDHALPQTTRKGVAPRREDRMNKQEYVKAVKAGPAPGGLGTPPARAKTSAANGTASALSACSSTG